MNLDDVHKIVPMWVIKARLAVAAYGLAYLKSVQDRQLEEMRKQWEKQAESREHPTSDT